jgi:hypothetical protein
MKKESLMRLSRLFAVLAALSLLAVLPTHVAAQMRAHTVSAGTRISTYDNHMVARAAASGPWSIQPTPNPSGGGALHAVSCPSSETCFAVGVSSTGTALAEWWNGMAWQIQPTPTTPEGIDGLTAVSCTAASFCMAVGSAGGAEWWNGMVWQPLPTPSPGGSNDTLLGVSCTSASACTAVGRYWSDGLGVWQTVAEGWNGSVWTIQPTVNFPAGSVLDGVSCTTASNCMAVGSASEIGCGPYHCRINLAIAEQWNGTSWTGAWGGLPASRGSIGLSAVSCPGTTACTGVGNTGASTFAAGWNGTAWATQSTQNPSANMSTYLASVSCTTPTACTAVGNYTNASGTTLTLAERYSG